MSDDGNGMIVYSMPPIDWWPGWVDEQLLWSDRRFWRDLFYDQNEFEELQDLADFDTLPEALDSIN